MSELLQKQFTFTRLVASLIEKAYALGYTLAFEEAWRTPEQAALNAKRGIGITHSLHTERLAIDFNLFKDGIWLEKSEDFLELGKYWESLSTPGFNCTWGGRFTRPDGNHFSIEDNGIK